MIGQSPPPQVFISHSEKDRSWAEAVCDWLEQRGIDCWISSRDIAPGTEWDNEVVKAIRSSRIVVLILSINAVHSRYVLNEIRIAAKGNMVIIPFRVDDTELEGLEVHIGGVQFLEARRLSEKQALADLHAQISVLIPTHPPPEDVRAESPWRKDDTLWEQLLTEIEDGAVIPIIGSDLLKVNIRGRSILLYTLLAERLAERLGVRVNPVSDQVVLQDVVRSLEAKDGGAKVYAALNQVFESSQDLEPPPTLLELARIPAFDLFVTMTFDPLLQRALDAVRFGGRPRTHVFAFSPSESIDLPRGSLHDTTVFHLFGRLSPVPQYALTEDDTLDFFKAFQAGWQQPSLLLDELSRRRLLILGSDLPPSLLRLLLRLLEGNRGLRAQQAEVFRGDEAIEFVAELARRWQERQDTDGGSKTWPRPVDQARRGAIYLSYAQEDLSTVLAFKEALERAGLAVWLDRNEVRVNVIRRQIKGSSMFVPVISRHTLAADARFFGVEWREAEEYAAQLQEGTRFARRRRRHFAG
jgi:hypothetical protein